jgi:hypothetical protein
MESTGVYRKAVWQAREDHFALVLANPFQVKNMPGRKTDARDCRWLAELPLTGSSGPALSRHARLAICGT